MKARGVGYGPILSLLAPFMYSRRRLMPHVSVSRSRFLNNSCSMQHALQRVAAMRTCVRLTVDTRVHSKALTQCGNAA